MQVVVVGKTSSAQKRLGNVLTELERILQPVSCTNYCCQQLRCTYDCPPDGKL